LPYNQAARCKKNDAKKDIQMNTVTFESKLLPDGHLYCPKEFAQKKNVLFKVIVMFEDVEMEASEQDIELSTINDHSTDFLSKKELSYYLTLEEL
jgi:hypothetical protein